MGSGFGFNGMGFGGFGPGFFGGFGGFGPGAFGGGASSGGGPDGRAGGYGSGGGGSYGVGGRGHSGSSSYDKDNYGDTPYGMADMKGSSVGERTPSAAMPGAGASSVSGYENMKQPNGCCIWPWWEFSRWFLATSLVWVTGVNLPVELEVFQRLGVG